MDNLQRPIARKEGLVIQEMPDEILVLRYGNQQSSLLKRNGGLCLESL